MIPTLFLGVVLSGIIPFDQQWHAWQGKPEGVQRLVQEARVLYYWGEADTALSREKWIAGRQKAEEAKKISPKDPGAILWWTANVGAMAREDRNFSALKKIKEIEMELLNLKKMDPGFGFAAADRVLGKLYEEAPRFISIGSTSDAEAHLKDALRLAGDFPGNRLAWIEFLVSEEKWDDVRREIDSLKARGWGGEFGDFNPEKREWPLRLEKAEKSLGGERT